VRSRQFIVDEPRKSLSVRLPKSLVQECEDVAHAMTWEARDRVAEREREGVKAITVSDVVRNALEHGLEALRGSQDSILPQIEIGPYGRMPASALWELVSREDTHPDERVDRDACYEYYKAQLLESRAAKEHPGHQEWLWEATVDELLDWTKSVK